MVSFWFGLLFSITFTVVVQRFVGVSKVPNVVPQSVANNALISDDVFHDPETLRLEYEQMEKDFKVYVYPEGRPYSFQSPQYLLFRFLLFLNLRKTNAVYPFLLKNILESPFSTTDASEAHLFFLPSPRDRFSKKKGAVAHNGKIISLWDYVEIIEAKYPYWNRTSGSDHFFLNCNEFSGYDVRYFIKNATNLMCPMELFNFLDFVPPIDVSVPTVRLRHSKSAIDAITRVFWANSAKDFWIFDHLSSEPARLSEFKTEEFCLCNKGIDVFDSIVNGCVPVILFSDYQDLPFSDILDWWKFSVIVKEVGLNHYNHIMRNLDHPRYKQLHRNLLKVQHHFVWNSPPVKYDAFHMVMYQLWSRHRAIKH